MNTLYWEFGRFIVNKPHDTFWINNKFYDKIYNLRDPDSNYNHSFKQEIIQYQ